MTFLFLDYLVSDIFVLSIHRIFLTFQPVWETVVDLKFQFMDIGSEMLNYFESNLGRIEILGSSNKIERIYFNIQSSSLDQWEAPQIRESKRQFIFDVVVDDGGEKGKMEEFVNFCEVSHALESVDPCHT